MYFALTRIKYYLPDLNERRLLASDFWSICDRQRCQVFEIPLENGGYYLTNGRDDYIFLSLYMREFIWLETAFHEMIHLLLHYPADFLLQKQQNEARALALIAMMPQKDLPALAREYDQLDTDLQFLFHKRLQVLSVTSY